MDQQICSPTQLSQKPHPGRLIVLKHQLLQQFGQTQTILQQI